ncbi:MAG: M67 family metallopeptidase [bacterium]|nr:M67 family metallopeptidase [bacterium]
MEPLSIDRATLDAILAHARETHPEECCGAIVARDGADVVHRFTNIQSRLHAEDAVNNPRDGTRGYTPEPKELLAVLHAGEEPGARLAVFYHSHPITGSYFSGEDRARAMFGDEPAYPDVAYLVVSDARIEGEARAFHWDDASLDFVEREVHVREPAAAGPDLAREAAVAASPVRKAATPPDGPASPPAVAKPRAKPRTKKAASPTAAAKKAAGGSMRTRSRPLPTTKAARGKAAKKAARKLAKKASPKVARSTAKRVVATASRGAAKKKVAARKSAPAKAVARKAVSQSAAKKRPPAKKTAAARARVKKK